MSEKSLTKLLLNIDKKICFICMGTKLIWNFFMKMLLILSNFIENQTYFTKKKLFKLVF